MHFADPRPWTGLSSIKRTQLRFVPSHPKKEKKGGALESFSIGLKGLALVAVGLRVGVLVNDEGRSTSHFRPIPPPHEAISCLALRNARQNVDLRRLNGHDWKTSKQFSKKKNSSNPPPLLVSLDGAIFVTVPGP